MLKFERYSRIPFRFKLFIIPVVAIFLFLFIAYVQRFYILEEHQKSQKIIVKDFESLKVLNDFNTKISLNFGDIHKLLIAVQRDRNIDEEHVYEMGKPLINTIHEQKKILNEQVLPIIEHKLNNRNSQELQTCFESYFKHATSALTMVTVDLQLAKREATNASIHYNELITLIELIKNNLLVLSRQTIHQSYQLETDNIDFVNMGILITVMLISLIGLGLSKELSQEYTLITKSINELAQNEADAQIPKIESRNELSRIFKGLQTFKDNMIQLKQLHNDTMHMQDQLFRSEKLALMGEMIGNIAHQWRQPLSIISSSASSMKVQQQIGVLKDEYLYDTCDTIVTNVEYLSQTIDDFKNFVKGERSKEVFNLKEAMQSIMILFEPNRSKFNITAQVEIEELEIDGYINDLAQCILNICNNAKDVLKDLDEEDRLLFINAHIDSEDKRFVSIYIKDSGGGIPQDVIDKIFEPYFTTKSESEGTGLGLSMTYKLITEGMNGKINVNNVTFRHNNKEYSGAQFNLKIPLI